jgi:hypothetical protein
MEAAAREAARTAVATLWILQATPEVTRAAVKAVNARQLSRCVANPKNISTQRAHDKAQA